MTSKIIWCYRVKSISTSLAVKGLTVSQTSLISCFNVQYQKISIPPPQKGLEFPGTWGVLLSPKNLKKCMKLIIGISRGGGGGGLRKKSLPWERYGYFLELHNRVTHDMERGRKTNLT